MTSHHAATTREPTEKLEGHISVDLALAKDFKNDSFSIWAGIDNIFNDGIYENSGDIYQQGRTFWVKSTFRF